MLIVFQLCTRFNYNRRCYKYLLSGLRIYEDMICLRYCFVFFSFPCKLILLFATFYCIYVLDLAKKYNKCSMCSGDNNMSLKLFHKNVNSNKWSFKS